MNDLIENLNKLPISTPLLKESHKILMENVRGKNKLPGEFRTSQNWIGGASLAEQRLEAKKQKNFTEADVLRDKLSSLGWKVVDTKDGFKLEKVGE